MVKTVGFGEFLLFSYARRFLFIRDKIKKKYWHCMPQNLCFVVLALAMKQDMKKSVDIQASFAFVANGSSNCGDSDGTCLR